MTWLNPIQKLPVSQLVNTFSDMKLFRPFVAVFTEDHQRSLLLIRGIFPQSDMFFSNMRFTRTPSSTFRKEVF